MGPDDEGEELGFDDSETLDDSDVVRLVSDDGEELTCVLLAVVDVEGRSYAVLTPLREGDDGEDDDDRDEGELLLATYDEDASGGARFGPVEDDGVVAALKVAIKDLVDVDDDEPTAGIFARPVGEA